jgi:hypothetical protein
MDANIKSEGDKSIDRQTLNYNSKQTDPVRDVKLKKQIMKNDVKSGTKVIPMVPSYYSFLLDEISDKKRRKCFGNALNKYNRACTKAFKQFMKDLEKCRKSK